MAAARSDERQMRLTATHTSSTSSRSCSYTAARTAGLIDWVVAAACRSAPQPVSPEGRRQRDSSERQL